MKKLTAILFLTAAVVCAQNGRADAFIFLDWDFSNSGQSFGPNDQVVQNAKLYNLSSSDENLTLTNFFSASRSTVPVPPGTYSGEFGAPGTNDFFTQFVGIDLEPGEEFDFIFSTYTPSGPTPAGSYETFHSIVFQKTPPEEAISFFSFQDSSLEQSTRNFTWSARGQEPVIPEPSSLLLLGSGLTALAAFRKQKIP
jgi:hypothetical protein